MHARQTMRRLASRAVLLRSIDDSADLELRRLRQPDHLSLLLAHRAARDRGKPAALFGELDAVLRGHVATQSERVRLRLLLRTCRRELVPELDWWIAENETTNPRHRPANLARDVALKAHVQALRPRWAQTVEEACRVVATRYVARWRAQKATVAELGQLLGTRRRISPRTSTEALADLLAAQLVRRYARHQQRVKLHRDRQKSTRRTA